MSPSRTPTSSSWLAIAADILPDVRCSGWGRTGLSPLVRAWRNDHRGCRVVPCLDFVRDPVTVFVKITSLPAVFALAACSAGHEAPASAPRAPPTPPSVVVELPPSG